MFKAKSSGLSLSIFNRNRLAKWLKQFKAITLAQNTPFRSNDIYYSPTNDLVSKKNHTSGITLLKRTPLAFLLLATQLYATNLSAAVFDWESATHNGSSATQTVDGITATATSPSNYIDVYNDGDYAGSSGKILESQNSLTISFSQAVNISSLLLIDYENTEDAWRLTPTGGSNSIDNQTVPADSSATAALNWTNVTGITINRPNFSSGYLPLFSIDNLVFTQIVTNNAPTASSFTVSNGPFENLTYTFSTANFGYSDGDSDPLNNLLIEQVPAAGTLYVDANNSDTYNSGEELSNGATVSKANLDAGNLQYIQNASTNTSFQFEVNDGTENSVGNYVATLNVTKTPTVTLSINPTSQLENLATNATVTATLSNTYGANTTVSLGFSGTAIGAGTDYNTSSSSITVNAGSTTGTITLSNVDDGLYEQDETVIVDITSVTNGTESGIQQTTYTITNDDPLPTPTITSASYNATTGTLVVTGTNFTAKSGFSNDVDVSQLTIQGEASGTRKLTGTSDVEIDSSTQFTVALSAADQLSVNALLNKNGTTSDDNTTYNLAAADDFISGMTTGNSGDLTGNGITVSNVPTPTITSATYDSSTGTLVVTGTNFTAKSGAANDVDVSKLTITGEGGGSYAHHLTTHDVEITSPTEFTVTLSANDKMSINGLLNKDGTSSDDAKTYNLAADDDFISGSTTGDTADSSNAITVSNVAIPTVSSATYDVSTGILVVTGTNFVKTTGAMNDVDTSMLTIMGEASGTYTLTSSDLEITSETSFSVALNTTDRKSVGALFTANGSSAASNTSYNLALADNWMPGAATTTDIADITNNGITVSNTLTSSITAQTNVSTYGGNDGSLTASMSGGTPPYTYAWSNGATTAITSQLAAGNYNVVLKDSIGLTRNITNIIVTQPAAQPVVTASLTDALLVDNNFNAAANPAETLRYTAVISSTVATASDVAFSLSPDILTTLVVGSVTTSQGSVTTGNTVGDTTVGIDIGSMSNGSSVTVTFDVQVGTPSSEPSTISLQGSISGSNFTTLNTNDPDTATADDATKLTFDGIVAAPVVSTPASALDVNTATQTISGTHGENGSTITLYADSNNDGIRDNSTALTSTTVSSNTWSLNALLTSNTNNNFVVRATDTALNESADIDVPTINHDDVTPSVSSIALSGSPAANATSIDFTVTFSEDVSGVNTDDFTLDSSGVTGSVTGINGTGSSYTVTVSSISGTGTVSIDLKASGTGIADTAGNTIQAGFTNGATHTVDTVVPTVSSITLSGTPAANATSVDYIVTFSESVTGVNTSDFTVDGSGVTGSITGVSGNGSSYTVSVGSISGTGTISIDLNTSSTGITDANANVIHGSFTAGATHTVDTNAPSVNSITVSGSPAANATSVDYTVTFSEAVTGVSTDDFAIDGSGATGSIASISGSDSSYTVTVSSVSGTGTLSIDLNSSGTSITDANGNAISTGYTTGDTHSVDTDAPSVSSIVLSGTSAANATSVSYTVTFSETVTGVSTDDFAVDSSDVTASITGISGSGSVYSVTVDSISGTGTLSIDLNASGTGITDDASNAISGGFNTGATHTVDTIVPTLSSIVLSGKPAANASSVDFVVTFSESVTGVDTNDFSVDGSGVTGSITGVSGSGSSYTVTVGSISGTGTISIDLNTSGTDITDANANAIHGGFTAGGTHTVDTESPSAPAKPDMATASDTGVNTADNVTSNTAPTFTGTAEANSIVVLTSSVDGQLGTIAANSTGEWSITATTLQSGSHNITVTAKDATGNTSASSTALAITIDNTDPRIASVTRSSPTTSATNADILTWQVTFDENVFNVGAADFSVSGTTATIAVTAVSAKVYDVAISGGDLATLNGTATLSWNGDHLSDRAGNTLSNLVVVGTNDNSFTLDNTAPTLTISTPTPTTTASGPATYTVTYADADSITLANANVSLNLTGTASADAPVVSGTGNTRTVTINNISGVGTIGITIAAGTASDNAGNTAATASSSTDILTNTPGAISISGYTKVGATLTANLVDPDGFTTVTYEWLSGGSVVGNNSSTYTITNNDLGKTITVSASYVDNITSSENVSSAPSSVVLSVKQFALDTISSNANNSNGFLPDENDYQDAGVTGVTPEILALINTAIIRQGGSTDVDSTTEIQTLVDAILEGQDSDGDGLPNIFEGDSTVDSDGDGIANRDDPDADNDGIADAIELASIAGDTDQDGILDAFDADVGNNAIVDDGKTDANFDGVIDEVDTLAKLIEFLINDADGDNYPDVVDTPNTLTKSEEEATPEAASIAPNTQQAFADVLFALMSIDSDDDGIPNYLDLDSDNDTLSDLYEAGFPDFNHDGLIDDGYDVVTDSTHLRDSDRDNIPDFLERKSDGVTFDILLGSFANDIAELDSNNDGQLDDATDTDGDGVADRVDPQDGFGTNPDTDNDGIANHLDLNNGTDIGVSNSGAGSVNTFILLGMLTLLGFKLRRKLVPLVILVFAGSVQAGNLELTAGIGSSFVDPVTSSSITVLDDKSFTTAIGVGYRFNKNWLVQARYQDLGNAEVGTTTDKRDVDVKAYSLSLQKTLVSPKGSPLELYGLIGVAKLDIDAENLSVEDDSPTDLQLGLGLKYTGMKHGFGFIEYTSYNEDMASLMIGAGKKF